MAVGVAEGNREVSHSSSQPGKCAHVDRHARVSGVTRSPVPEHGSPSTGRALRPGALDALSVLVLHLRLGQNSTVNGTC